jgi:hypothetical protein
MTTPTLASLIWQAVNAPEDTDRGALLKPDLGQVSDVVLVACR